LNFKEYGTTQKKMVYAGSVRYQEDGKEAVINRKGNFVGRSKVRDMFSSLAHVRREGHKRKKLHP
jgi:hypothetical protein